MAADNIFLQSVDGGEAFPISRDAVRLSVTLNNSAELAIDGQNVTLPVSVRPEILKLVIQWCEFHKNHQTEDTRSESEEAEIKEWSREFYQIENDVLHDLFMASDYLEIMPMLQDCATQAASLVNGHTLQEMLELFGLADAPDVSDSDEEERENQDEQSEESDESE